MTKIVVLRANHLYKLLDDDVDFVVRIGKNYWQNEYYDLCLNSGCVIAFVSPERNSAEIGVIITESSKDDLFGVRQIISNTEKLIPQFETTEVIENTKVRVSSLMLSIHIADVLCVFKPYAHVEEKKKKLWRLWLSYSIGGTTKEITITVDEDLQLLKEVRRDLLSKCTSEDMYDYTITEVTSV